MKFLLLCCCLLCFRPSFPFDETNWILPGRWSVCVTLWTIRDGFLRFWLFASSRFFVIEHTSIRFLRNWISNWVYIAPFNFDPEFVALLLLLEIRKEKPQKEAKKKRWNAFIWRESRFNDRYWHLERLVKVVFCCQRTFHGTIKRIEVQKRNEYKIRIWKARSIFRDFFPIDSFLLPTLSQFK